MADNFFFEMEETEQSSAVGDSAAVLTQDIEQMASQRSQDRRNELQVT